MSFIDQIRPVLGGLEDDAITSALSDIPIIADDLTSLIDSLNLDDIETALDDALEAVDDTLGAAARATAIAAALDDLDGITAVAAGTVVTTTLTAQTDANVELLDADIGLGGSAFSLDAQADFTGSIGVELDLNLTYDTATDTLELVDTPEDELTLSTSISADVAASATIASGVIGAELTDTLDTPEIALTAGFNLASLTPSDFSVTYGGSAQLQLNLATVVAEDLLPGVTTDLSIEWDPLDPSNVPTIMFSDVGMKVGDLLDAVADLLDPITDILFEGIIGDIVNILTEPLPIINEGLNAVGLIDEFDTIPTSGDGIFNLLDGLGLYFAGTGNTQAVKILSGFAEALAILKQLSDFAENDGIIPLGDIMIPGFDADLDAPDLPSFSVADIGGMSPIEFLNDLANTTDLFSQVLDSVPGLSDAGIAALTTATEEDDSGLSFPLFENPERIIDVLLPELTGSGPVPLIEYDIPAISSEARFGEYFFRIFGPFGLTIDGFAEATIDFTVGYDTFALQNPGSSFLDGLFLTTEEMMPGEQIERQPEDLQFEFRPIAYSSAGIFAGVAVDAVVLRVGVKGGIVGFVAAFLPGGEVDTDAGEVPNGVLRLSDFGSGCFLDPILGRIGAEVIASIKVGFGFFSFVLETTIADITLANFEFGCPPATEEIDGLARYVDTGLLLHVGNEAGSRVIEGQAGTDIGETYRISEAIDEDGNPVAGALRVEFDGTFQNFGVDDGEPAPTEINANFGDEDDALVISAGLNVAVNVSGGDGNDILEGAALVDTLNGDDGNDRLFGRGGNDILNGGDGEDYLEGGAGADELNGGADRDRVSYETSAVGVSLAWNGSRIIGSGGDAEGDVLDSIEYLIGSAFDDVLTANPTESSTLQGNAGNDVLIGGSEDDFLLGDAGADRMIGGGGQDGTSYVTSLGLVNIDLASGAASGGDAAGDVLISIESVMGSAFDDVLSGTTGTNMISGWIGDDVLDGRGGDDIITADQGDDTVYGRGDGAELLDGGSGRDLLSYERASTAVTVDLGAGTAEGSGTDTLGFVQTEQPDGTFADGSLSTFEDLDGSNNADDLTGDEQNNTIQGLGGSDTINGAGGDDLLRGGLGADDLDGGDGTDWADYTDGFGVTVSLAAGDVGSGSTAQGDVLTNIENLRGSDGSDILTGNDIANVFDPLLSTAIGDVVDGGLGNDTLLLDYSKGDFGQGMTGGLSTGRFERLSFNGLTVLDAVGFSNIDNFHVTATFRDDTIDTGAGDDRLYLGGGDDVVNSGSGSDIVLAQEGNDTVSYFSNDDAPVFYLNGGRDVDGLSLRLAGVSEDMTVRAGFGDGINTILSSGSSVVLFENLDVVRTGEGADLIEQGGISDNDLHGGGNADVINPGRGIDTVNGGFDIVTSAPQFQISDRPFYVLSDAVQLTEVLTGEGDTLVLNWSDVNSAINTDVDRFLSALAGVETDGVNNTNVSLAFFSHSGTYETADGLDRTNFANIEAVDITGGDFDDEITGTWAGLELQFSVGDSVTPSIAFESERGKDVLRGGLGEDTLVGLTGSDILLGGEDNDTLIGTDPDLDPADGDGIPFDAFEIDTLTGGTGADRFVLGTLQTDDEITSERVFYRGRVGQDNDETDSRAIITDFNATEGDRLVLAGRASDYTVEVTDGGVNILLAEGPRNIIAFLEGLDSLVLDNTTTEFRTAFNFPIFPILPVLPVVPIFTPTFFDDGLAAIVPANFALTSTTALAATLAEASTRTAPTFEGQSLLDDVQVTPLSQLEALDVDPEIPAAIDLDTPPVIAALEDDLWVNQNNIPSLLEDTLFEGTTGEITGGTLTLEGDGRAFGIFDGDPFGLGTGIVLSTGIAEDLDGINEIDGGLYGPFTPELSFENIGEFNDSGIFRADLSFVGTALNSITIQDDGDAEGGARGAFSGLELDALVLSRQLVTAQDIADGLDFNDPTQFTRLDVFNYATAFSQFTPGSIRSSSGPSPTDLQGTDNGLIDLTQARLGEFSYTPQPFNTGSFTLGDGGKVGFDLTETVDTDGPLYLYVAEGFANEELEATITASDARLAAPADLSTDFGAEGAEGDLTRLTYTFDMAEDAGKMLKFDFAFVTEELREFAGTEFNDELRIFLNGVQLAELSDGTALTVSQLLPAPFAASHPDLLFNTVADGPIRTETRADAYTTPLTFAGRTVAGENTLVIEVEDVRDGLMDSAVLIRAGSLDIDDEDDGVIGQPPDGGDPTGTTPGVAISAANITVTEGEPPVELEISLTGILALTADVTLTLTPFNDDIDLGAGAGVAQMITFTAGGSLSQTVQISAPLDGIEEPTEFVLASVDISGGTIFDTVPVAPLVVEVLDATATETTPFDISLGDAPDRFSRANPTAWADAWTADGVTITQSADAEADIWSAINLGTLNPGTFGGSSLHQGDLGVSGRTVPWLDGRPQEIDGTEGLRFQLDDAQTGTGFSGQFAGFDTDVVAGANDAARVVLYSDGAEVDTFYFTAADGRDFAADATAEFDTLVISAGSLNGGGTDFVFGALDDGVDPTPPAASQFRLEDITLNGFEIL